MNQAVYAEKMTCANCKLTIKSGDTCYLLDFPGEVIVCSKRCGIDYQNKHLGFRGE